ncbi:glycosyltransferase [Salipaludibacillus sp. CF4.18]|uniref:glycosyltransferase n=1 Tax=Salipaludibacillus sp. CF4.18 TaxID=3373081 RepID=UPI003EE5F6B0
MKRILIYADIDLNKIDGSAIWISSIAQTFASTKENEVFLLLKRPILIDKLVQPLINNENITIINPWEAYKKDFSKLEMKNDWIQRKRLLPEEAHEMMLHLDEIHGFSLSLVRGFNLSKLVAHNNNIAYKTWFYLTDFPQRIDEVSDDDLGHLIKIYKNGSRLACQTPELIKYFKNLLAVSKDNKFIYLPPMVSSVREDIKEFKNNNNAIVYAGKFAPHWMIPNMFKAFKKIDDENIIFNIAGDKFLNFPYTAKYDEYVIRHFNEDSRINWYKALTRNEVQELIYESDLGISWRDEILNDSMELSTKVLEYGANGKPVIVNRNELHEKVLGEDYPLFANNEKEFISKVQLALSDNNIYKNAAERIYELSKNYSFEKVGKYLSEFIDEDDKSKEYRRLIQKTNILFAGHDLKFAAMIINYFKAHPEYNVLIDQWKGHNSHDEQQSKELLSQTDIVFAEWGLGNAVWYSQNIKKHQKMLIRMHAQEKNTDYPKQINWENIDRIVFIAPGLKQDMADHFYFPEKKSEIIYNLVDSYSLDRPKLPGSEFNIGFMGISPRSKRFDMTLDIFEKLWKEDNRFTLFVKGKFPNEYPWLWKREEEKEYYLKIFRRINSSKWRNSVVFDGFGKDISEWFRKIGFIMSTSDFESFHLSIAEGMASGSMPIIRDWFGASLLYPNEFIIDSVDKGADIIKTNIDKISQDSYRETLKEYIDENFEKTKICNKWEKLLGEL